MNRARWTLLAMVVLAMIVGRIPIISWPFNWLETFFHELSHGLAAILTGGRIVQIELAWNGAGLCHHAGGVRLVTSFAGYFGSVCWGVAIYLAASAIHRRHATILATGLALTVGLSLLLWMRDPVTLLIGAILTALFTLAIRWGDLPLAKPFLQLCGMSVLLEGLRSPLVLLSPGIEGDGATLFKLTWIPEFVWVGIWLAWGIAALVYLWRHEGRRQALASEPIA